MSEPRRSGCGTFIAVAGLVGWSLMVITWLGDHLVIVVPICVVLLAGIIFLAIDSSGTH